MTNNKSAYSACSGPHGFAIPLEFNESTAKIVEVLAIYLCQPSLDCDETSRFEADMLGRFSRILVVDGCAESRRTTNGFLHALGYANVEFAPHGGQALRLLGKNQYRLVLADWDMAHVDGLQLLRMIRADPRSRRIPFLMAIARSQKKFVEIARDDGATLYINKPFTMELLADRIVQVVSAANHAGDVRGQTVLASVPVLASSGIAPAGMSPARMSMVPKLWQSLRRPP